MTPLLLALALGVTGTWLSPTEISVQADVPAVGSPLGLPVDWYLQVYRYSTSPWPEVVATAVLLVDPGKAQSISITLEVPRPIYGTGQVIVRAAHDSAAGLDYQASVQWPYWSILRDDFEACGTSPTLAYAPLPCTHLWRWRRAVGYDATLIFRDGFESGDTARWERSVP